MIKFIYMNLEFKAILINNSLENYLLSGIIFVSLIIGFKVFRKIFLHRLFKLAKKSKNDVDDLLVNLIKSISPLFDIYLAFYISSKFLELKLLSKWLDIILIVWIMIELGSKLKILIDYLAIKHFKKNDSQAPVGILKKISVFLIWSLGILIILSRLGVNITSLVAGLGIGGIAIALAIQNILGDLFSSLSIYFDKPFEIGDFIVVGESKGTVEKIGLKTTRIRALGGEELVVPNNDLTSARIQNFKKMKLRRVAFKIGVEYGTDSKKLKKIPQIIKEIVKSVNLIRFDRVNFESFGNSSLDFEIVYYVKSNDYNVYVELQEKINFKIIESFKKEGIEFAFPSQTVYLKK